jgi:hypothetical protein
MLDLIISTLAFFVAVFFLNRYFDEQGMDKGMSRSLLVFLLASVVSVCVPLAVDFVSDGIGGHKSAASEENGDVAQLLKLLSAVHGH